ncbi:MAG: metal-dependent hydrolase [Tannerella sp.]|jgi:inner membrane protein|nr:metal-dependent hydrolase [Tannerella sp.]
MNASTHIIGGAVFTGTMCSFVDVNIFSDWTYLAVCAGFSILPDIDTTKSAIGKVCYPVAWILYRKVGHRTLTHSLLFFAFVWALLWSLTHFGFIQDTQILKIALFALLSHFIFDMMTVAGIPLLYPLFRNPCVIPGNPAYRFESGSFRSELAVTGVCGLLCVTMQPLFTNGFWTSYNRTFATIQHVDRENQNTEFYVICEYSYIQNATKYEGEAMVMESKETELVLFDRKRVFKLSSNDPQTKIIHTKPRISDIEKRFAEIQFFNVSYDSLQNILDDKLASGLIQSNYNVHYVEDAISYYTNFIKFANRYDFEIFAGEDSSRTSIRNNIEKIKASITQHQASIRQYRAKYDDDYRKYLAHNKEIADLETSLSDKSLSNYERNRRQKDLMKLKGKSNEEPVYMPPLAQLAALDAQLAELVRQQKAMSERYLLFSGHLTVYQFGYTNAESQAIIPNFDVNKTSLFAHVNF